MSSFREGDLVTIRGQIQKVESNFLMIALEGAIDAAVPAIVSDTSVSLVRPSIHDGDEVQGGHRVHSSIPNTPLVLLQLIDGDPNDPASFSTAVRDMLVLVRTSKGDAPAVAPAADAIPTSEPEAPLPQTAGPQASDSSPPVAEAAADSPAAEVSSTTAEVSADAPVPVIPTPSAGKAGSDAVDDGSVRTDDGSAPGEGDTRAEAVGGETAPRPAETMRSPDLAGRFGGIATEALRASQGGSIASLGRVREEQSPLKPIEEELVLRDHIEDDHS